MSKKRNLCKAFIVVIACLTVIMMFSMTSVARDFVETDRKCTLDLTYKYEETFFSGVEVNIYKVASFNKVGEFELAGAFADYAVDVVNVKSQDEWNALADTLAAYVVADSLMPTATATTNENGVAAFADLEVGLYLIGGFIAEYIDNGTVQYDDFLISVPGVGTTVIDAEGGYSNNDQTLLLAVVPTRQYYIVKEGLKEIDKDVYYLVCDSYEVSNDKGDYLCY